MAMEVESTAVLIVGAGPAGLAITACLTLKSIPFILLEKEDCCASLWKRRAYDRCHLHLSKEFCSLPYMPHSKITQRYLSKDEFTQYIDTYASRFNVRPRYCHIVESATFDKVDGKWHVEAIDTVTSVVKRFTSVFLVVASGENDKGYVPNFPGLDGFKGDIVHSSQYKCGLTYRDKRVLVVGCGNSGMEIAYDLSDYGAKTSIVIRNPIHVVTRDMVCMGMHLLKYLPISSVDKMVTLASKFKYGDLSEFGIHRPKKGPFLLKSSTGRSPVIDVGTVGKIKAGEIKVLPAISRINDNNVIFVDGVESLFDAIIFATGYKSTACQWLKDYEYILNKNGFPRNRFPNHWKGDNNLYCAGLARMGLQGVSNDAKAIVDDIVKILGQPSNVTVNY